MTGLASRRDGNGAACEVTVAAGEVTVERCGKARELEQLAHTDAITCLPNRRALEQAPPRELARAERPAQPLCLAIVDLDDFKAVTTPTATDR